MTHLEKAVELQKNGYHCSQAIVGAFANELGYNLKDCFKISTCFGAGMREGGTCGCITASFMVLGMAFGFYDPQDKELELYGNKKAEEFLALFKERMAGDITCKAILGQDISKPEGLAVIRKEGLMLKLCPRAMRVCIAIVEEMIDDYHKRKNDFSHQNTAEEAIDLTSIINQADKRRKFTGNVTKLLDSTDKKVAFVQFDIKRFKIINDLYGEKFGDEVLFFISENLKSLCGDRQYFMNLRADVFSIVTEYETDSELDDLITRLEQNFVEFKEVKLQLSFGVYTVEDWEMEIRQMEDRAAIARKAAKAEVVTNRLFYQEQFKELLYTRKFIEENMNAAIDEKQFQMYLQPKYSISRNKIVGAEALVRWIHPQRGMVYPGEFIPIFEENGFIRMVDYYIWEEACHFLKRCADLGIRDCPVSVNVSRQHLKDMDFMQVLVANIRESRIEKSLLELEITETANDEKISKMAEQLKKDGFTLLMDDFGSGYSSLNVLLETPFDVLKLDKKFMDNMMASEKGKLILEHVVAMAKKLELGLLAEGVETKEQVELLSKIGCDRVQGYYYAKPMPQEEFFEMLCKDRGVLEKNMQK